MKHDSIRQGLLGPKDLNPVSKASVFSPRLSNRELRDRFNRMPSKALKKKRTMLFANDLELDKESCGTSSFDLRDPKQLGMYLTFITKESKDTLEKLGKSVHQLNLGINLLKSEM